MSAVETTFEEMNNRLTAEAAEKINATYLFKVGGESDGWFADLTKSEGPWIEKTAEDKEAECVVTVDNADDWVQLASGKMNATMAFMQGKVKIKGNMGLAMKLQGLLG